MADADKPSEIIKTATELAKTLPIYQDALQPAAKELGKSLATVASVVNVALLPVTALVWGAEKLRDFVETKVTSKLQNTPPDQIITPKPNVAGPALESLRYNGEEHELHDLYANLLAEAMDARTANGVLPSYVEILKQLSSDEAKLLRLFAVPNRPFPLVHMLRAKQDENQNPAGEEVVSRSISFLGIEARVAYPRMTPVYIDSIERLGLIELFRGRAYVALGVYAAIENSPEANALRETIERSSPGWTPKIERSGLQMTELGRSFTSACLVDHATKFPAQPASTQK